MSGWREGEIGAALPRLLLAVDIFAGRLADAMADDSCSYCRGAGHVSRGLVRVRSDVIEQVIERCPKCNPERPRGIPLLRMTNTFEHFDVKRNPGMKAALARCKAVAAGLEWCAVLTGAYGTGKTHLGIAALQEFGRGAFWKAPEILTYIRRRMFEDGVPEELAILEFQDDSGLLVVDDLGTEKLSEWAESVLYLIFDARYEQQLPTIITTNAPKERINGRVWSRYKAGLVLCTGKDMRA